MAKMGGYRPGAGRPRRGEQSISSLRAGAVIPDETDAALAAEDAETVDRASQPLPQDLEALSPLEYMLRVMNNRRAPADRRDRMAIAAAPFMHERKADATTGKKEQKKQRAEASASKYATPEPPATAPLN